MALNFTCLNGRNDKVAAGGRITRKFIHFSADLSAKAMANMMEPPIWSYTWQFVSYTARLISARNLSLNRHKPEQSDPKRAETQEFREHVVLSYLYTCCKGRVIWIMSIGHSVVCPTDPVCRVSLYSDIFPFSRPWQDLPMASYLLLSLGPFSDGRNGQHG
jgi:hypothetical protein